MPSFDYTASAELYPGRGSFKSRYVEYKRFATAAEAIQYAIEVMPVVLLHGVILELDEERFDKFAIRALYDAPDYPLPKPPCA